MTLEGKFSLFNLSVTITQEKNFMLTHQKY